MSEVRGLLDDALPFAMEPVVYDFGINPQGTLAALDSSSDAMMPPQYYALQRASDHRGRRQPCLTTAGPTSTTSPPDAPNTGELVQALSHDDQSSFPGLAG